MTFSGPHSPHWGPVSLISPWGTGASPAHLCTIWGLTPSTSPCGLGKTKDGSAEFPLRSWRLLDTQPHPESVVYLGAWHERIKLGNPHFFPTA